jgi:two-component system response regulator FixJ
MPDRSRRLVHVVDDDRGVRSALATLLRASGYAVESWESGEALLDALPQPGRGVILLDLRMPGRDGLDVLDALRSRGTHFPVILLTGHGDVGNAVRAMKSGALDFLQKPVEPAALFEVVARAHEQLDELGRRERFAADAALALARLTPRERDILARLARGDSYTQVAAALAISPRTVEVHRANLLTRLDVRNLPEALRIAFAAGLAVESVTTG